MPNTLEQYTSPTTTAKYTRERISYTYRDGISSENVLCPKKFDAEMCPTTVIDGDVEVRVVTKNASILVGAFSAVALAVSAGSSLVIIHPFVAIILLIGSIGFYLMALGTKRG